MKRIVTYLGLLGLLLLTACDFQTIGSDEQFVGNENEYRSSEEINESNTLNLPNEKGNEQQVYCEDGFANMNEDLQRNESSQLSENDIAELSEMTWNRARLDEMVGDEVRDLEERYSVAFGNPIPDLENHITLDQVREAVQKSLDEGSENAVLELMCWWDSEYYSEGKNLLERYMETFGHFPPAVARGVTFSEMEMAILQSLAAQSEDAVLYLTRWRNETTHAGYRLNAIFREEFGHNMPLVSGGRFYYLTLGEVSEAVWQAVESGYADDVLEVLKQPAYIWTFFRNRRLAELDAEYRRAFRTLGLSSHLRQAVEMGVRSRVPSIMIDELEEVVHRSIAEGVNHVLAEVLATFDD